MNSRDVTIGKLESQTNKMFTDLFFPDFGNNKPGG